MTDDTDPIDDADSWVIPLHGTPFPPTSADSGAAPPILGVAGPAAEVPPLPPAVLNHSDGSLPYLPAEEEELPTEGFHPRLRRSA
jgi:hypothetical protein